MISTRVLWGRNAAGWCGSPTSSRVPTGSRRRSRRSRPSTDLKPASGAHTWRGMWIADLESLSDEDLVRRFVADGVSDAVDVLLRRHQDRVLGLAYRILGNRTDALDAAQEVFVAVFRKASLFRHQSAFTTWLYRLTVNACNDHARRRSRLPQPALAIEVAVDVASPDAIGMADDRMAIAGALRNLPLDQRTAVIMRGLP